MTTTTDTQTFTLTLASLSQITMSGLAATLVDNLRGQGWTVNIEKGGQVTLTIPQDWTATPMGDNGLLTDIADPQNHCRALFIKAPSGATLSLKCRYEVDVYLAPSIQEPEKEGQDRWCMVVRDYSQAPTEPGATMHHGKVVFSTPAYNNKDYQQDQQAEHQCQTWLRRAYPDHKNPFAYWDD